MASHHGRAAGAGWRGKPLFKGLHDQLKLKHLKTKVFGSGVVLLDYQSDRKEPK
jgi:hypothetical protein